jgi:hypothetical protein
VVASSGSAVGSGACAGTSFAGVSSDTDVGGGVWQ